MLHLIFKCILISFISFGYHQALAHADTHTVPECSKKCATTFGMVLGGSGQTIGYSNCNNDCESDLWNSMQLANGEKIRTGMKWQCVEYARRWLNTELGYTFASIDHAYQIWDLEEVNSLTTHKKVRWLKFANATSKEKPSRGDLLIYNTEQGIHGHVSVIVGLANNEALIAEQNYANKVWENKNYARRIPLIQNANGTYELKDLGIIGWMRVNK